MSGVLLILFISGGVGATALGSWLFFQRRLRLQPPVASHPPGVQPAIRPLPAAPKDPRVRPEPAETAPPSDDETWACVNSAVVTMLAVPDGTEILEDPRPANVERPVPPDPEPAQAAELCSSNEGSDACPNAPTADAVPEAIEILDHPSPANAEEAMRGADRHAEAPLATAEEPGVQAGAAAPKPQPLLRETAAPGIATSPGVPKRSASGSAALADDQLLVRHGHGADGCTAEKASETPVTEAGASETEAVLNAAMVDGTAVPTAECGTAPAELLADVNGEDGQQPMPKTAAVAGFPESGAEAVTPDLAKDADAQAGQPEAEEGPLSEARPRPSKPAQHRDRRGQRRTAKSQSGADSKASPAALAEMLRVPAEARLRLMLHPLRRTVALSAVLARPAGYPDRVTLLSGTGTEVGAYSENRYDDVDLEWTPNLLSGELRLDSKEGYQWLRSSRRVHIFTEQADEPGMISVGSASLGSPSAIVCREDDVEAVRSAAAACGSAELISHDRWTGAPEGWVVLSGYRPAHAASSTLDLSLKALDPGIGAVIRLSGALEVRARSFAQGSPPRIEIEPIPVGARVTIDGASAEMEEDGSWRAAGWDAPGDHLVDVVPGRSLIYRILPDPWLDGGWDRWDAHPERFPQSNGAPWARAQICGASLLGPSGEHVVAAEAVATVIVLGVRRGAAVLRTRPDAPVAVGLLREAPAFLVSSSGRRRTQGRVDWLAPSPRSATSRGIDLQWVAEVRSASSRRLPLSGADTAGRDAWRRARERARRYRKAGA